MTTPPKERGLLSAGVAVPILYFGTQIVASLFYPGYSHVTQYASELGSAAARWPAIFNFGILLTGLATVAGAAGMYTSMTRQGLGKYLVGLAAVLIGLTGVSLIFGAAFPMPDPRHGAFGMGMGIHIAPPLLAIALPAIGAYRTLDRYLVVTFFAMLAFFALMMGVGGVVTTDNVGVFQRLYALSMFPFIGITCWLLRGVPIPTA